MPSSAVRMFTDPDDYAASIRGGSVELTVTGRGAFNAKLTRVELHRLWMQRFSERVSRVVDATTIKARTYITFRVQPGPSLLQAGVEIDPSVILRHNQAHEYYQRSSGLAEFGTMSLPVEDIASLGEALAGVDLTTPHGAMSITPAPAAMAKLQRLHAAAGQLAENVPKVITHPEAAHGLEQALIEAMVACLGEGAVGEDRSALGTTQ
jgi:hypothetical protein